MAEKIWDAKESGTLDDDLRKDHAREKARKKKMVHQDPSSPGRYFCRWLDKTSSKRT